MAMGKEKPNPKDKVDYKQDVKEYKTGKPDSKALDAKEKKKK